MNDLQARPRALLVFLGLILTTACVYWPSLQGGYFFDDSIWLLSDPAVRVTTLRLADWIRAAGAECGVNLLCRPLSSLSFAANWYFTGIDPFWFKVTNLVIHLANGIWLFFALGALFRLRDAIRGEERNRSFAAALLAGAWLLLPIHLTSVAYVSQRMEALATSFVFLGLAGYLNARRRLFCGEPAGISLWLSILVGTGLGLTAKEDAALLPLFTACVEFALTGFRDRDRRWSKTVVALHLVSLVLPLIAGLLWVVPKILHGASNIRSFTLAQRLLTEPRVLCDYIAWTLLPNLNSLTFFHDDLAISQNLLDPPTTVMAILGLVALFGLALAQRRARPLFCLGILWFFAGHSMTATILPLELVFEHRNYFPSVGLLLAAASWLGLETELRLRAVPAVAIASCLALYTVTTFLRAEEWSHPLRLAYAEALKRPASARAQYELARTLIVAAGENPTSPLIDRAVEILQRTAFRADSGITPLQALIFVNGRAHRPIDPRWWQAMVAKLRAAPPSQSDIAAIVFLFHCQQRGDCPPQPEPLLAVFLAGLESSGGDLNLKSAYADFALHELGDAELAERMAREVVAAAPADPTYRENLIRVLIASHRFDELPAEFAALEKLNRLGSLDRDLAALRAEWRSAEAHALAKDTPSH
jgi:hypothetical protein